MMLSFLPCPTLSQHERCFFHVLHRTTNRSGANLFFKIVAGYTIAVLIVAVHVVCFNTVVCVVNIIDTLFVAIIQQVVIPGFC